MRGIIILVALVFILTLTTTIGLRVRSEGRAFFLGLGCGLLASLPASALAFYLTQQRESQAAPPQRRSQPPLVILAGAPAAPAPPLPDYPPLTATDTMPTEQTYRIIGEEGQ